MKYVLPHLAILVIQMTAPLFLINQKLFAAPTDNEQTNTHESNNNLKSENTWQFSLDGSDLLLKGFGAELHKSLTENFALGVYHKSFKLSDPDYKTSFAASKHEVSEYGVKLGYFTNGFSKDGFVLSAAIGNISAKSTGRYDLLGDKYPEFRNESSVLSSKTARQIFSSYQFLGANIFQQASIVIRLGLGYGTGGKFSVNYGGTKNEIMDGAIFDINGGILF